MAGPALTDWVGRRETLTDQATPAQAAKMHCLLDRPGPAPGPGDPLPAFWHWIYFNDVAPQAELGPDGHPRRGGNMPPVALPRRMFAGNRLQVKGEIRVGDKLSRTSEILSVTEKQGRQGPLVFVTVRHVTATPRGPAIEEERDIVYRDGGGAGGGGSGGEPVDLGGAAWRRTVTPDPVLLFRYSALTFNGHRIHYDRAYATDVEGYPGLVVQGPLTATYLWHLAADHGSAKATGTRPIRHFAFRARSPLFDTAPFSLAGWPTTDGGGARLVAVTPSGQLAQSAEVEFG